ncbi:hypothetical protein Pmani_004778 [Petrolisthes manimaculis]|uniref:Uncharacterized protein n=1 Tax=Petrolisthes manimaculis TaxID=1843537 RepID=A0AAE1QG47_9EUCA|nr:hypothetical protein Pmani_004778 [Petrolisthes manimaculis]
MYRTDRKNRSHGGVASYVRNDLAIEAELLLSYSNGVVEINMLHLKEVKLILVNIYRPPGSKTEKFKAALDSYFLEQIVLRPTRGQNKLDFVFANSQELIHSYEINQTALSDHKLNTLQIFTKARGSTHCTVGTIQQEGLQALHFHHESIKWDNLNAELKDIDWPKVMECGEIDHMLEKFLKSLIRKCWEHIPNRKIPGTRKRSHIPQVRKNLMRKRASLWNKLAVTCDKNGQCTLAARIEGIEKKIIQSHKAERQKEEEKAINMIKENPRYFFQYAKRYLRTREQIGPLLTEEGIQKEPQQICEALSAQYQKVFNSPDKRKMVIHPQAFFQEIPEHDEPMDITVTVEDITKALKALKDGVPAVLLKNCSQALAAPLTVLWQKSLDIDVVPKSLKSALITPIHKASSTILATQLHIWHQLLALEVTVPTP